MQSCSSVLAAGERCHDMHGTAMHITQLWLSFKRLDHVSVSKLPHPQVYSLPHKDQEIGSEAT